MANISERLFKLRSDKQLLQKDVAKDAGLALRSYIYYEHGERKPDSDTLIKLADYFDVSLDWLTGRSETRERQP